MSLTLSSKLTDNPRHVVATAPVIETAIADQAASQQAVKSKSLAGMAGELLNAEPGHSTSRWLHSMPPIIRQCDCRALPPTLQRGVIGTVRPMNK